MPKKKTTVTKTVTPAPVALKEKTNTAIEKPVVVAPTKSRGVSSNAFACGANQNAGNFITDRSTTRIHAPPGGRSSITFG